MRPLSFVSKLRTIWSQRRSFQNVVAPSTISPPTSSSVKRRARCRTMSRTSMSPIWNIHLLRVIARVSILMAQHHQPAITFSWIKCRALVISSFRCKTVTCLEVSALSPSSPACSDKSSRLTSASRNWTRIRCKTLVMFSKLTSTSRKYATRRRTSTSTR